MGLRWKSAKETTLFTSGSLPARTAWCGSHAPAGLDQPADRLRRCGLSFERPADPASLVNAMGEYMGMLDAVRIGNVNQAKLAIVPRRPGRARAAPQGVWLLWRCVHDGRRACWTARTCLDNPVPQPGHRPPGRALADGADQDPGRRNRRHHGRPAATA